MSSESSQPFNPVIASKLQTKLEAFVTPTHPGAICIANYKGGVGKTTVVALLGYYLAEWGERVLMLDIDPQCSLSLAMGFDPERVSKTELTIHNLVKPSKWSRIRQTNFDSYIVRVPDRLAPQNLRIIPGSFEVENLDLEIAEEVAGKNNQRLHQLCLYCKQMLNAFDQYDIVLIDCPPNKMYLTQAMLRAASFYLPVTIPDAISIYGMPRLLRWVKKIPSGERPKLLGYVLNAVNRTGGAPGGMVYSQQAAARRLAQSILGDLDAEEKSVLESEPAVGRIPRLDAIARFLGENSGVKYSRFDFRVSGSEQPTIDDCMTVITETVLYRMGAYNATQGARSTSRQDA